LIFDNVFSNFPNGPSGNNFPALFFSFSKNASKPFSLYIFSDSSENTTASASNAIRISFSLGLKSLGIL
jgi:hypothetical protein